MLRKINARYTNVVYGFLLSGIMTLIVSAVSTVRNLGWDDATVGKWLAAYATAWPVTFPTVLVVAPIVRRLVLHLIAPPAAQPQPASR